MKHGGLVAGDTRAVARVHWIISHGAWTLPLVDCGCCTRRARAARRQLQERDEVSLGLHRNQATGLTFSLCAGSDGLLCCSLARLGIVAKQKPGRDITLLSLPAPCIRKEVYHPILHCIRWLRRPHKRQISTSLEQRLV